MNRISYPPLSANEDLQSRALLERARPLLEPGGNSATSSVAESEQLTVRQAVDRFVIDAAHRISILPLDIENVSPHECRQQIYTLLQVQADKVIAALQTMLRNRWGHHISVINDGGDVRIASQAVEQAVAG